MKIWFLLFLLVFVPANGYGQNIKPRFNELKQVSQLPAEIPQRVSALAYDGEKLWVAVYQDNGNFATFNPATGEWKASDDEKHRIVFMQVAAPWAAAGGMAFVDKKLWIAGSYGESIGLVNVDEWKIEKQFKEKQRLNKTSSENYAGMAYDGIHLWIGSHKFNYKIPAAQSQIVLKMNPDTGQIVAKYPLPPGTVNDGTHALAWDGKNLWHMKDSKLSAINSNNGEVIAQYIVGEIKRPSGMVWDGAALWIIEFSGKLWRLPL